MNIRQVNVEIMNRSFIIGTPETERDTLLQAVDLLNKKINAVKGHGKIIETDKIIIMAALNVVHDLLKMSMKDGLAIGEFERRIADMVEVSNKVLGETS